MAQGLAPQALREPVRLFFSPRSRPGTAAPPDASARAVPRWSRRPPTPWSAQVIEPHLVAPGATAGRHPGTVIGTRPSCSAPDARSSGGQPDARESWCGMRP